MTDFVFPPRPVPSLPIVGTTSQYPVGRIFCVGRNYVAHAAEMGGEVDREAPWYFTKSAHALCHSDQTVPFPLQTSTFHHEIEHVVALGSDAIEVDEGRALGAVYGYACGLDMTRRDRQQDGKDARRPWSLGKDIENGAVIGAITPAVEFGAVGKQSITLTVNDEPRQSAKLSDMVWSVSEIIAHLSRFYHLGAGDLIMTGTPAGVGPVVAGDVIKGHIDGLAGISHRLAHSDT